jgi:hypothetical protein
VPAVVEVNKIEEGLGKPPAPAAHLLLIGIAIGGRECRGWDHLALQRRRRFAFWGVVWRSKAHAVQYKFLLVTNAGSA